MKVNPSGMGREYFVDSPVFIDIVLVLSAIGFGSVAWLKWQQVPPSYIAAVLLAAAGVLCLLLITAQKRRTFLFDASAQTLTWTSRGFRENTSGTTAFKDVRITLDPSTGEGPTQYRIIVTTPNGSWPLCTGYDANQSRVQAQATRLRAMLGQSADGLLDDSVTQLKKAGNLISAATVLGHQRGIPTADAFKSIIDSQESKPDSRHS